MKSIEEIKGAVRIIRAGGTVDGFTVDGDTVTADGRKYLVQGDVRLRVTEVPLEAEAAPEHAGEPASPAPAKEGGKERARRPAGERAVDSEETCGACGATFVKSKFNPYFTECPSCRRKARPAAAGERSFTCSECGGQFTVSKFQPYLSPDRCPKCTRKAAHKRYMDKRGKA